MLLQKDEVKHIGIIGGGPAALFMYKRLVESKQKLHITIFEKNDVLGPGMPYSAFGACAEHVTNVSGNEIPDIVYPVKEWIRTAEEDVLLPFDMQAQLFNDYKVIPRLFFGQYLAAQFRLLHQAAEKAGIITVVLNHTFVIDIEDEAGNEQVKVYTDAGDSYIFDSVIIGTGHTWPQKNEGKIPGWFDSPYPPSKLPQHSNYSVAIKGASLTAIDAVRTLARMNGVFTKNEDSTLNYTLHPDSTDFKIVLHSLSGLLPAIRFHLEDSQLAPGSALGAEEVHEMMAANEGFIPLDYIFEKNFKQPIQKEDPEFYEKIKEMTLEVFVENMMSLRKNLDAFTLFKAEYREAEKSIKRRQSVYWKEMLAVLSYAMNYPAKHLSAEDMLRLKRVLMPLISVVIAFVPQSSCRELMALHDAGVLTLVTVDKESKVEPMETGGCRYFFMDEDGGEKSVEYKMFIDATGQAPVMFKDFPFKGLVKNGTVSEAFLKFRNNEEAFKEIEEKNPLVVNTAANSFYLQVPGININDNFQVLDKYGVYNNRIYIMAVPLIAGINPDYSGLDFCEKASERIAAALLDNSSEIMQQKLLQ